MDKFILTLLFLFQSTDKVVSHLGKVLGAVQFRDVWTDTAEVLIRQVSNYNNY
jgi:hypothetical protein